MLETDTRESTFAGNSFLESQRQHMRLLDYWRSLEMLQRQHSPFSDSRQLVDGSILTSIDCSGDAQYPWGTLTEEAGRRGTHTVYLGLFSLSEAYALIEGVQGCSVEPGKASRRGFSLAACRVHGTTGYEAGSFSLSTSAWVTGRLLGGLSARDGFEAARDEFCAYAEQKLLSTSISEVSQALRFLSEHLVTQLGLSRLYETDALRHLVVTRVDSPHGLMPVEHGPVCLNSLYLGDIELAHARARAGDMPAALSAFLGAEKPLVKLDLTADEGRDFAVQRLTPCQSGYGAWPGGEDLSCSEGVAINLVRKELRDAPGLQAIFSPDEAGSHRLIREVVIESLLTNADTLTSFPRISMAFSRAKGRESEWVLHPHLAQDGGVAVVLPPDSDGEAARLCEKLALRLEASDCETDRHLSGFVRYGLQVLDMTGDGGSCDQVNAALRDSGGLLSLVDASAKDALPYKVGLKLWDDSCYRYQEAKHRVSSLLHDMPDLPGGIKRAVELRTRITGVRRAITYSESALAQHEVVHQALEADLSRFVSELVLVKNAPAVSSGSSGLERFVFRFLRKGASDGGGLSRRVELGGLIARVKARLGVVAKVAEADRCEVSRLKRELEDLESDFDVAAKALLPYCDGYRLEYLRTWLCDSTQSDFAGDLAGDFDSALHGERVAQARETLAYEAVRLQAVFMRLASSRLRGGLRKGLRHIAGVEAEPLRGKAMKSVWSTLQQAVPVMVMTNAQMARLCRDVDGEGFNWVVQCGADRVRPWEVLGAVYRGRGVVILGDKQATGLSEQPGHHARVMLAREMGVCVSRTGAEPCAQAMAEAGSSFGAVRRVGAVYDWVGIPLEPETNSGEPAVGAEVISDHPGEARARRAGGA